MCSEGHTFLNGTGPPSASSLQLPHRSVQGELLRLEEWLDRGLVDWDSGHLGQTQICDLVQVT